MALRSSRRTSRDDEDDKTPRKNGLGIRFLKQSRGLHNWRQLVSSRIQLDTPEFPEQHPNKIKTRGDPPAAFSLQIARIQQWPFHRTFLKSLKKSKNNLMVSVHVSFFHLPSSAFFGNTWQSKEVEVNMRSLKGSGDQAFRTGEVDLNEIIYWYTFVDDNRTAVVLELVASEYDMDEGVQVGSIGCGWSIINPSPFGHRGLLGGDNPSELSSLPLFTGTPRSLVMCGASQPRDLVAMIQAGRLEGVSQWNKSVIKYRIAHFPKLLKARHLFAENEIVGSRDLVPGLVKRKLGGDAKNERAAVLGDRMLQAFDDSKVAIPASGVHVSRRRVTHLEVSKCSVKIQDSFALEAAMARHFDWSMREDESKLAAYRRLTHSSASGVPSVLETQAAEKAQLSNPCTIGFKLMSKRLRFMCHNGRTFTSAGCVIPLEEKPRTTSDNEGNGAPVSELVATKASKTWTVGNLQYSPYAAIVVFLEYVVRPDQSGMRLPGIEPSEPNDREEWINSHTTQVPVIVGSSFYLPWDGKLFRLRSSFDPRILVPVDGHANKFELPLAVDATTCNLTSHHPERPLVWPSGGADELFDAVRGDKDKAFRYVKFSCEAFCLEEESMAKARATGENLSKTPLRDATPAPADEIDDEGEEKEGDESDSADSSEESSDEESVARKPASPKKSSPRKTRREDITSLGDTLMGPESPRTPQSLETADSDLWARSGVVPHRRTDFDTPEASPREERHMNFGRATSSLLAQTLQVPLGGGGPTRKGNVFFGDVTTILGPSQPTTFASSLNMGYDGTVHEMTRGSKALADMSLSRLGGGTSRFTATQPNLWGAPNLSLEMGDSNCLNAVFVRFLAVRATSPTSPLPERLSFSFRFFDKPPRRTPAATVGEVSGSLNNSKPHPLIYEGAAGAAGLEERIVVDVSEISTCEALDFFTYLATRKLQIDVWDGDSLILLGSASVPLRPLLREQKNSVQVALEYDIIKDRDDDSVGIGVIGRLQLSLTNYGGKGRGGVAGAAGPVKVAPMHEPVGPFNWRFVSDVPQTVGGEGTNRPTHRKRARPLIDSGGSELKHAVDDMTHDKVGGGSLAYSGTAKWSEGNTVSYEDLSSLAKRFRSPNMKGYVAYRGPLLQLLDAPSIVNAEKKLVADLAMLEERGGRSLEAIAKLLDRNNVGFINSDDLVVGLKSLCPSSFGRLRSREANMLTGRIERGTQKQVDGYPVLSRGGISVEDLVAWVRSRQGGGNTETKLERLFRVFELKSGVASSEVMKGCPNASEFIAVVRSMQQTIGGKDATSDPMFLSDSMLKQFVENQGGQIDSVPYLTKLGLFVEKKVSKAVLSELRLSILNITEARMGSVFDSWLDGSSHTVTVDAAVQHLSKYGLNRRIKNQEDARMAVCELDTDSDGLISCSDLFRFVEWSWDRHLEELMRSLLISMEGVGEGLKVVIGSGDEVMQAVRLRHIIQDNSETKLPRYISDSDIDEFLKRIGSGGKSASDREVMNFAKKDIVAFGSMSLKRILLAVEASGTMSIHEIFQSMDKDSNGTLTHDELMEGLRLNTADIKAELTQEVDAAVQGLGNGQGVALRDFMALVGRHFSTYLEARLEAVIRKSKIDISTVFGALDKDGDGTVSVDELLAALLEISGFEDAKPEDVKELLSQFDSDGDGSVSLQEFCKVMGQHFRASDTEAMFVKLLGRAVKLGFSLRQCFDELDHSSDGEVDATELQVGLIALGGSIPMFKDIQPEDIQSLVKHISGNDSGIVTRDAFLSWGKKHKLGDEEDLAVPPKKVESLHREESSEDRAARDRETTTTRQDGKDDGTTEESKSAHMDDKTQEEKQDGDSSLIADYVFSSDPFTAAAERKLRRVAQSFQSRAERLGGWCDVEEIFTRYDRAGVGCIMKAEFVNVLMQLGLSLVDIPTGGESHLTATSSERQRRLAQLSRVKGGAMDKTARFRARDNELSRIGKEGDEELALIKWYREGQKKGLVKNMVEAGVKSEYHIFPRFGSSVFFEHPLVNPFNGEERLMVEIEGSSGLRLLTDFEEWVHFRRHVEPPPGFPHLAASVEPDMFAVDRGGAQLLVGARETVPLPLAFLSLSESHMAEEHTCSVKLISAKHGVVVGLIEIHIHPRAPIVHRNLRFNQGEGSIVKRHIRLPPEDSGKFISPIEFGEKRVVVESRVAPDGCQEIGIKYAKLSGFPSSGDFYLLIFDDEYRSKLYELWHVVVSSRLRKDIHGSVGVASMLELVVRGERHERLVRAFSSNRGDISFHPFGSFVLHPGVYNQISLSWLPKEAGSSTEHVHLVDMETNQLVVAWLISTVANPPQVSKEFDVDVVVGEAAHKRVSYVNPWSRAQSYTLRSSDPNRMRPKTDRLHIDAHGQAYIRLFIAPVERAGVSEVFLLVNDEQDQNDECFRIIIRADA